MVSQLSSFMLPVGMTPALSLSLFPRQAADLRRRDCGGSAVLAMEESGADFYENINDTSGLEPRVGDKNG